MTVVFVTGVVTKVLTTNQRTQTIIMEPELVIVEWRDIIATSGWEQEPTCPTFFNVGWLVREDKDVIVLATTKDLDDFTGESSDPPPVYYGFHSFPRGAVVSVRPVSS